MERSPKVYFVSDLHLGAPNHEASIKRERHFVAWLDTIKADVQELFLVGDIFDFWFEYKRAVPKGFVRLLGKLAELADNGTRVHIFIGNHDLWYKDYFTEQFGATIHYGPYTTEFFGKKFHVAHGDGLGPGDHGYKFLKWVMQNPVNRWLYARLHPNSGIGLASFFSGQSRNHEYEGNPTGREMILKGYDEDVLCVYSREVLKESPDINYFIYGHRHILFEKQLSSSASCYILGDWIHYFSFLEASEEGIFVKSYPMDS